RDLFRLRLMELALPHFRYGTVSDALHNDFLIPTRKEILSITAVNRLYENALKGTSMIVVVSLIGRGAENHFKLNSNGN
ncbi:hypothetical protein K0M31_001628, partial [Melipona bicolor]